jgi:hypothetical protein
MKSAKDNYNLERLIYDSCSCCAEKGIYGNSGEEAIYPTYFVDAEGATI